MAVLLQDNFNRADSTNALGAPQVGGPYTVVSGTWGINANRAYTSVGSSSAKVTFPAARDVEVSFAIGANVSTSIQPGVMFRYIDANNFWALHSRVGSGTVGLYYVRGGSNNLMLSAAGAQGAGAVLRAVAKGPDIAMYADNVLIGRTQDPAWEANATLAGMMSWGTGLTYIDDLLVSDFTGEVNDDWGTSPEAFDGVDLGFIADAAYSTSLYKGRDTAAADESEIP